MTTSKHAPVAEYYKGLELSLRTYVASLERLRKLRTLEHAKGCLLELMKKYEDLCSDLSYSDEERIKELHDYAHRYHTSLTNSADAEEPNPAKWMFYHPEPRHTLQMPYEDEET